MPDAVVQGDSAPLDDDDTRKRELVRKLVASENKAVAKFAKHLVTVAFSAVAVVLALQDKWLGPSATNAQKIQLGLSLSAYLAAALVGSFATGLFGVRVSLSDYGDVDAELHRVAASRRRLTNIALGLIIAATALAGWLALWPALS